MDRDKRWERVTEAYDALVDAKAKPAASAKDAVDQGYAANQDDEFVSPAVIDGYTGMKDGDGVLMFNYRSDRAREILTALLDPMFDGFKRARIVKFAAAVGMVEYSAALNAFLKPLFPPETIKMGLGETVSKAGLRQLRIAETEKYAHVTFFFNGGEERVFDGEDRILVPSPKVKTYDLKPEMSAGEVTDKLVEAIGSGKYDLVVGKYYCAYLKGAASGTNCAGGTADVNRFFPATGNHDYSDGLIANYTAYFALPGTELVYSQVVGDVEFDALCGQTPLAQLRQTRPRLQASGTHPVGRVEEGHLPGPGGPLGYRLYSPTLTI